MDEPIEKQFTALIAISDAFQRLAIMDILILSNFEVVDCENGLQTQEQLLKNEITFDIILLDLNMAKMGGLELLNFIKKEDQWKNIPVIILSEDGDVNVVAQCLKAGASDYLVKPISVKTLQGLQNYCPQKKQIKEGEKDED